MATNKKKKNIPSFAEWCEEQYGDTINDARLTKEEEEQAKARLANLGRGKSNKDIAPTKSKANNEIAPVKTTTNKPVTSMHEYYQANKKPDEIHASTLKTTEKGGEKDSWLKSGAFWDGYDFGDVSKTILGTAGDAIGGAVRGAASTVEGIANLGAYGVAGVSNLFGNEELAEKAKKWAMESAVDESRNNKQTKFVDQYSIIGNKGDNITEGLGQLGLIIATGGVGASAGLTQGGVTALTSSITGLSSMGSGMSEAYNDNATDGEAFIYGLGTGAIEAGTEFLFGGLGRSVKALGISRGIGGLDDMFAKKLSSTITKAITKDGVRQAVANTVEWGVKSAGESVEEVLSGIGSAVMKWLTYEDDKTLKQLIKDENLLEQAVTGFFVSLIGQGGDFAKATVNGKDFVTRHSASDEKVINAVVEKEVAKREANGEKLSPKEKNEIYDSVSESAENGSLDIDTIEEILGGENYTSYKKAVEENTALKNERDELNKIKTMELTGEQSDRLAELKSMNLDDTTKTDELKAKVSDDVFNLVNKDGSMLMESYREKERRSQKFEADLSKYKGKQREAVERAINSGVLNNTNRSHELVNILSKIESDKGIVFDYTNNAKLKESGFSVEGKTINGFVKDGNVTLNMESHKAWESTVGHEIGHVLKGTEAYGALRESLFKYAESKGELETRRKALAEMYKGLEADIDEELTSDLIGDYIFNDKNFINHLVKDRNVFQKVYDEIKYLWNVATGKEKAQIEKVKREFDKAWNELSAETKTTDKATKYSLSGKNAKTANNSMLAKAESMLDSGVDSETIRQETGWYKGYDGKWRFEIDDSEFSFYRNGRYESPEISRYKELADKVYKREETEAEFEEFRTLYKSLKDEERNPYRLIDYIEHEKLFEAYPQLEDVRLKFHTSENLKNMGVDENALAYYDPQTKTIVLNEDKIGTNEQTKQNLIHEIQHAIQDIEGFAKGASVDYWKAKRQDIVDTIRGAKENLDLWLNDIGYSDFVETSMDKVISKEKTLEQHWADCEEFKANSKYAKQIMACEEELAEYQRKYDIITNGMSAFEQYQNTAGEIEARDAENRLNLNAEERRNKRPDIDRENVVFADAKYSLSEDSNGNKLSLAVQKRFANSKAVDENGNLKVLYHGTASGEFYTFDKSKGSVEGDFGSGFYFTDSEGDVEANYEGGGPDFENKVERRAEQIEQEEDIDYSEAEARAREELDKGSFKHTVYLNIENPAVVGETYLLDYESFAEEYDRDDYDSDEDYEADVEYIIQDKIDGIIWDIEKNIDIYSTDGISQVLWEAVNEGGIGIEQLKSRINELYLEDENGNFVGNEVTRQIIESLGYDGIIDNTVSKKFNMGLSEDTTHYIVFKPNQIKSIDNQNPTDDPDIRFSLSNEVEETNDMVAVHNLTEDKLLKTLNLGGFPMPSIAVTKADKGHSTYGNISVVLRKDTIDPKKSPKNDVYSGDAGSSVFPQTVSDVTFSKEAYDKVIKRVESAKGKLHYFPSYEGLLDKLNSPSSSPFVGETDTTVTKALFDEEDLQDAFLAEKGAEGDSIYKHEDEYREWLNDLFSEVEEKPMLFDYLTGEKKEVTPENAVELMTKYSYDDETYAKAGLNKFASVDEIKANVEKLKDIGYFEAKPKRVVGFDEIESVIIPKNASAEVRNALAENNIPFVEYEDGNNQSRLEALNSLENAKFSLSNEGEKSTVGTPLRDLYLEQDIAPVKETAPVEEKTATKADTFYNEYAPATAEEVEALNKESYDHLTDEDAPPEVVQYGDYVPDSISLDTKSLKQLLKLVGEKMPIADRYAKADLERVVQKFIKGEIATKEELFAEIKKKFGVDYQKQRNDYVAGLKASIKKQKVNVSDAIKRDMGEKYGEFFRKHFGQIRFAKDGIAVDTFYQILNNAYPGIFPDDVINPSDQLEKIGEFVRTPVTTVVAQPIDEGTLRDVTNFIYDNVTEYKDTTRFMNALDAEKAPIDESLMPPAKEGEEVTAPVVETETSGEQKAPISERLADGTRGEELLYESLDNHPVQTVEQKVAEKIRSVEGQLADNRELRIEAENNYNNKIAKLQAEYASKQDKNTLTANNLLKSISRLEGLKARADADYSKRISDLEARLEKMQTPEYSRAMRRQAKMQEHADFAKKLLGDISTWVDKKLGLQYATNTERRNLRDIVRDENGNVDIAHADEINDALNGRYNREHAELNRELAQIRKKYADLKITRAEDEYIQMLGEFKYNPDTTLTKEDVDKFLEKHKNKIDTKKVDKVIEMARKDYDDFFIRVNEVLREQGMAEIPYRQGYFPHTHAPDPKQNFLQKLLNWKTQNHEIPTSIAGLTEDFRPGKSWQPFDKRRKGDKTEYSFTKGFDRYSEGALDWIYHLDTIQKRRAVENEIRSAYSDEGVKAKIKEVYANEEYDANEAQAQIEQILSVSESHLSHFVQDFTTHTNILANKKNSLDRTVEQMTNRNIYSVMQNVQNRMSANMVLANVRSAMTNFIPITQSWAQVSPARSLQATKDVIANAIKDDGIINKSTLLTNRLKEADKLYKTKWDKVLDASGIMFEVIDNFSSQVVWRSKYNDNLAKGMNEADAIANADQFAENVMAGRSKGNEPTLFNAKNPLVKAFTMFQLEVNNQYGYLFKDVPNDLKAETNHWKLNLAKGYATAFVGAYVYNELLSRVTGSDAALDPIGIIEDLLRDLGLFGDDEEEEFTDTMKNLGKNVVEEVPFIGGLLGGGRVPISSAIPYGDKYSGGFAQAGEDVASAVGAVGDVIKGNEADWSGAKNLGKEMMKPVLNIGLPVGGGQIKKTVQGLGMFSDEHPVTGSYTDSGKLRFPVEDTPLNRLQAGLFGQYASKNAREYFDNDYAPLGEKQIQEYQDVDLPISDYWKYREGLSNLKPLEGKGSVTLNQKGDYIGGLDLPVSKKNILMNNIADRSTPIDFTGYEDYANFEEFDFAQRYPDTYAVLKEQGISVADYKQNYEETAFLHTDDYSWAGDNPEKYAVSKAVTSDVTEYKRYTSDLYNLKADKDANGKSINGSRKEKVIDYVSNLDIDYGAKLILFKSEYPSDDTYNYEIIDYINNRQDLTYDERVTIYEELGFTVQDGYVNW